MNNIPANRSTQLNLHESKIKEFLSDLAFIEKEGKQYWINIHTREIFLNISVLTQNPFITKAVLVKDSNSTCFQVLFEYNGYYYEKSIEQFIILSEMDNKDFKNKFNPTRFSTTSEDILEGAKLSISGDILEIISGNNFIQACKLIGLQPKPIANLQNFIASKRDEVSQKLLLK